MTNITQSKFAKYLGLKESTFNKYWLGNQRPRLARAQQLETLTSIPAGDWMAAPVDELKAKIVAWGQEQQII